MLKFQIRGKDLSSIKSLSDAALYAEQLLGAEALKEEFESGVMRRKAFCQALDIGESTLSTWLQTGRIPRAVALAYVLWLSVKVITDEIRQRDDSLAQPIVVRSRDGYAVVQRGDEARGEEFGSIIASGIETAGLAREIASTRSPQFRKVLDQAIAVLRENEERLDDEGADNWVADITAELERARDFKVGLPTIEELA